MLPSVLELGIAKNRSLIGQSYLIILALKVAGVIRRTLEASLSKRFPCPWFCHMFSVLLVLASSGYISLFHLSNNEGNTN